MPSISNTYFFNNYTEFLDQNQFNPWKPDLYFSQLFDFLDEYFHVDKESLTLIDDDYEITSHDNYTGQKTSISLRDYIKWTTDIKKRNCEKNLIFSLIMFEKQIGPMSKRNE